jgi:uncharacterized protein (DUF2132 family)
MTSEHRSKDPLHGITLQMMLTNLVAYMGWERLGQEINIRCFNHEPSIASSLKFLRRTPWARAKVESLYLFAQRERRRAETMVGDQNDGKMADEGGEFIDRAAK